MSYQRKNEDNRRLVKLYQKTKGSVEGGAFYDKKKKRYVRYYISDYGQNYVRYARRMCNKRIRRMVELGNYGYYKKASDYCNTII